MRYLFLLIAFGATSCPVGAAASPRGESSDVENEVGKWLQARGLLAGSPVVCDQVSHPLLAAEIIKRYEADQALRADPPINNKKMAEIGRDNGEFLEGAFYAFDQNWPDSCQIGLKAADAALILLQHSPDLEFRKLALIAISRAVNRGNLRKSQIPMIADRIALEDGRPQEFGTQLICGRNGHLRPTEISDPKAVDNRREAYDLPPLRMYVKLLNSEANNGCIKH